MSNYKRRFGDRSDGRKLRTLQPMSMVSPYIMKTRNDACNQIALSLDTAISDAYIAKKKEEGLKGFSYLHFFIASYVRTASQRPGINRFISGQKIYARNKIEVALTIKKKMALNADETVIKCTFEPTDTATDIYNKINAVIEQNKSEEEESGFDSAAKIFNYIPGLLLRFAVGCLFFLDYFGILPKVILKISPFHASFFITSMGSLSIPPIFHHLYNFGNCPIFCSYGMKRKAYELDKDGNVVPKKYIDYTFVTDERICDGHYFASALRQMAHYMNNPEVFDTPPETVVEDIK